VELKLKETKPAATAATASKQATKNLLPHIKFESFFIFLSPKKINLGASSFSD
jgi:hypothetical protein